MTPEKAKTISCVKPSNYSIRFNNFITTHIIG